MFGFLLKKCLEPNNTNQANPNAMSSEEQQPLKPNIEEESDQGSRTDIPNRRRWLPLMFLGSIFAIGALAMGFMRIEISSGLLEIATYRSCQVFEPKRNVQVIQTSLGAPSAHWSRVSCHAFKHNSNERFKAPTASINVDFGEVVGKDRPPILGFGGAFTEAAAVNFMSLKDGGRKAVMELLFGSSGLGYSLGRVHINSCDFSVKSYSFDDHDMDLDLQHFDNDVKHDVDSGMIEMMTQARVVVEEEWYTDLKIIAAPWSPPPWMKAPTDVDDAGAVHAKNMTGSHEPSCLREGTGPESRFAKAWALYFSKFINAYKNQGVNLWGVSVQNEPEFPAPWEACSYDSTVEGEFIANHLGPLLSEHHPELKLFAFDHNKDHAVEWMNDLLSPSNPAAQYIDGTGVHWYAGGMDRLLDGGVGSPNMHRLIHDVEKLKVKEEHIVLGSEACHCPSTGYAGGDLGVAWARAERYAHTVLADLAAGSNGWIDWNLLLDSVGGPNHLSNVCDGPLLAVPHRAKEAEGVPATMPFEHANHPFGPVIGDSRTAEELNALGTPADYLNEGVVVQPMYYYMGHISRHVRPGSRPVKGIVDSSGPVEGWIFRGSGKEVPGGGINDLARIGIELTTWPCEGSTRQEFYHNEVGQIQVFGHDWKGHPTKSCMSKAVDESFQGLLLTDCKKKYGLFELQRTEEYEGTETLVRIVLKNGAAEPGNSCMVIKPLENDGGAYGSRGGAQVIIGDCTDPSAIWKYSKETGQISSTFFEQDGGSVCLTTGWPFLQMVAFETPTSNESSKVVVILNEASEAANFILNDGGKVILASSIPAHSIQTVLFD